MGVGKLQTSSYIAQGGQRLVIETGGTLAYLHGLLKDGNRGHKAPRAQLDECDVTLFEHFCLAVNGYNPQDGDNITHIIGRPRLIQQLGHVAYVVNFDSLHTLPTAVNHHQQ